MNRILVSPSILSADFSCLGMEVAFSRAGWCGLDPRRYHGWAFCAEYLIWS